METSSARDATTPSAQNMPTGGLLDIVGGVVRPVTNDIVDPVVSDVAVPVLAGVVDPVVNQTVQPVLGHTVGPLVGSVLDPVVDNVAAPVVGQEVSPALAGAVVTVTHAATGTAPASTSSASPTPSWEQTGTAQSTQTVQWNYQISYRPGLSTGGIDEVLGSTAQDSSATGTIGIWAIDLGAILPQPAGPTATARGTLLMHDSAAYNSTSATPSQPTGTTGRKITSDTHSPVSQPVSLPMHEQSNHAPAGSTSSAGGGTASAGSLAGIATDPVEGWFSNATGRGPIHADDLPTGPCFGPGCFPD